MAEILFWVYLANAVVLINHEIDSAYWKEWELFRLPGGITGILILHFPLLLFVLYGLVLVRELAMARKEDDSCGSLEAGTRAWWIALQHRDCFPQGSGWI